MLVAHTRCEFFLCIPFVCGDFLPPRPKRICPVYNPKSKELIEENTYNRLYSAAYYFPYILPGRLPIRCKMTDDDDDEAFRGLYEDGHWAWDENEMGLVFVSDRPPLANEDIQILLTKVPTGTIEFRDDLDLLEQIRFRRRYQRKLKPGQADIITLQDVKDIVLYTAPVNILSPALINMLHISTTERFIRSLILFCQYYLQVEDEMALRMLETENKIRTPDCEIIEREFQENLADLRILIAKEYSLMIIGGGDTKPFHHMGPAKKRRSLSDKDARLFETLLRICVQIVWLALGRKSFNQIELEVNRIFKSEIFNAVEHRLKTSYIANMTEEQRSVLTGNCVRHDKKLNSCSPLLNELNCERPVDYRLLGLGVIKYPNLTIRMRYMMLATAGPEDILLENNVVLGIIGMPRSGFDTMLRPVLLATDSKSKATISGSGVCSVSKSITTVKKMYPDVEIPVKDYKEELFQPSSFPEEPEIPKPCSQTQKLRWQKRLGRLLHNH